MLDGNLAVKHSQMRERNFPAQRGQAVAPGPNRKRHAIEAAPHRWGLLGELLQARRLELGYKHRPAFARERLPLTGDGNPNVRLVADIENNYRDSYPAGTLRQLARAYEIAYSSLAAVLRGETDALAPSGAPAPAVTPDAGQMPPMSEPARIASARPYADRIHARLRHLAAQGITDPDGTQVFPRSPADAKTWDGTAGRWDLDDQVWMIADMQRRDGGRNGSRSETG